MGDALMQLSEVLRSKSDKENITTSEKQLVYNCMVKMVKNFFIGAVASSAVVYRATRRLGHWNSLYISAGSSFLIGKLVFNRSGNACLDQILSMEGSQMQRELANILLRNHWENPSRMRLIQKHFYPEVILSDLNPDMSLVRWRARNVYVDGDVSESHGICEAGENVETQSFMESTSNLSHVNTFQNNVDGDFLADPLECVFGNQEQSEDIHHVGGTDFTRQRRHAQRRGRKHHGAHHAKAFSPSVKDKQHLYRN